MEDKRVLAAIYGMEGMIGHIVSQYKRLNREGLLLGLYRECRSVLRDYNIPEYLIQEIVREGFEQGRIEFLLGMDAKTSSELKPYETLPQAIAVLVSVLGVNA